MWDILAKEYGLHNEVLVEDNVKIAEYKLNHELLICLKVISDCYKLSALLPDSQDSPLD